jgi:hypothetical protein
MKRKMGNDSTEKLAQKFSQFEQLPEQCTACAEPFDKKSKDMVQSWSVVVRQETIRLFCPECIRKTKEVLENVKNTED